jgi:hypothetical protein
MDNLRVDNRCNELNRFAIDAESVWSDRGLAASGRVFRPGLPPVASRQQARSAG